MVILLVQYRHKHNIDKSQTFVFFFQLLNKSISFAFVRYNFFFHLCFIFFLNGTNELIYKTEIELQMQKRNLWLPGGNGEGRINWEIRIEIYIILYVKQITSKNLLYSTGNSTQQSVMTYIGTYISTQQSVMTYMGKESKEEWIHVHV